MRPTRPRSRCIIGDVGAEGDYDGFVLSANYDGGVLAAQYMVEQLADVEGPKEVLMILLHPGSAVGEVRAAGFRDEMAKHEDFTIVAELDGNDSVEGGFGVTRDTLAGQPEPGGHLRHQRPRGHRRRPGAGRGGQERRDDRRLQRRRPGPRARQVRRHGRHHPPGPLRPGQGRRRGRADAPRRAAPDLLRRGDQSIYFPVEVVTADNVDEFMAPAE